MEQRRKIVVPTGTEAEESLSTPHFVDNEATLLARPVVPLGDQAATPPRQHDAHGGRAYAPGAAISPWKRSTLIMVVLAAVSVGIASGLAIGLYQSSRRAAPAPVATQPSVNEPQQATTQPQPELPEPVRVTKPEEQPEESEAEAPAILPAGDEERAERAAEKAADRQDERENKREARNMRTQDEGRATPAPVGERASARDDEVNTREEKREERRERRREERRRQRAEDNDAPLNVPRNVERARQEINRIRDIFEGRQP